MQSILNELRRRNVFRVAATYAVVVWVMGQGANLILPTFEAPDWVLKVVIALLLIGFPIVIILTWAYELTPEGLRRTPEQGEVARHWTNARLVDSVMIIALVAAVITMTAMNTGWSSGKTRSGDGSQAEERATEETAIRAAVLPLVGVNTDPATELLAHGLTDELIVQLRQLRGLDLTGAASSFSYSGNKATLEDVGKWLGVSRILQGSIRSSDGQVAVNVQLVSVPEGKELWAVELQRPKAELLSVRDAIVSGLAQYLSLRSTRLNGNDVTSALNESAIYEDWLRLLGHLRKGEPKNLQQARVIAQQLTTRAPKFGEGYAALAFASFAAAESADVLNRAGEVSSSKVLLDQALTLSPRSQRVLEWRAEVESRMFRWRSRGEDYERIAADFRHALELFPEHPALITAFAEHCAAWAEYAQAVELARRALKRDPRSESAYAVLIKSLLALGRHDAAAEAASTMSEVFPGSDPPLRFSAEIAAARADLDQALALYGKITRPGPDVIRAMVRIHASRHDTKAAVDALSQWPDDAASTLERDIWRKALEKDAAEAFILAEDLLAPVRIDDAALLGRLSVQSGHFTQAIDYFDRYFADWIKDAGPLVGDVAWINAPWFAFALKMVGRDEDARRLLDRHLTGLVTMEGRLAPAARELYLAANYAVQGRENDALKALERSAGHGLRVTWSALGAPIALQDVALLNSLPANPGFTKLLSRLNGQNGVQTSTPAKSTEGP